MNIKCENCGVKPKEQTLVDFSNSDWTCLKETCIDGRTVNTFFCAKCATIAFAPKSLGSPPPVDRMPPGFYADTPSKNILGCYVDGCTEKKTHPTWHKTRGNNRVRVEFCNVHIEEYNKGIL